MTQKLTQLEVEKIFQEKGCRLLDKYLFYQGSMKYICKCGEIAQTSLYGFKKSKGCRKCNTHHLSLKYTHEEVVKIFEQNGCALLSKEYVSNGSPLNYKCNCGNISKIKLRDFNKGHRCRQCMARFNSELFRTPNDEIKVICEQNGCQFIESFIHKSRTRIKYICKCGRQSEAYFDNFKRYPNCWECSKEKKRGANCYMYDPDREAVALRKKFRKVCEQLIRRALKCSDGKKSDNTYKVLGYSPQDLQSHILNHPNYVNCQNEYHIDHIFPIQAFLDHNIKDMKIINALDNLRPISILENLSKADNYDKLEFEQWLKTKIEVEV